ncbi:transcriptional regulator [Streptomyces sp. NWU339]|uniref:helix-turn-helix domain-containing protein n=1 Tax=Streptomyces sp. NWU339 TaxID=2185284 RepID=UPI000D67A580|nr:helix-turn-helix transcriptional regulator [Streptomyces sp. NWU339]PWI08961.1 transcriptional regulator [Streptomyces sp. NWU339]
MPDRVFDGSKLRDRRVVKRLSQADLAAGLNVKTNAVYRWENQLATPPQERLPAIAAMVGAELDELFPRLGPPNLADLRCDVGMRQSDTTRYTNTASPMPIRAAERGRRALSDEAVTALAAAYNVTRAELLAAQRRSFGHDVPVVKPEKTTSSPRVGDTIAEKINYLQTEVFDGVVPSDADLASSGNRKSGQSLLTEELVRDLRAGRRLTAPDDVLEALALAFDVPPVFFRSSDPEIGRLVVSACAVRSQFTVMAARGGEQKVSQEVRDQLRDFISDTMAEILGSDADDVPT